MVIRFEYTNSKFHYPALDGLRGLAILGVMLFHLFKFRIGWTGVDLFFVLSGFLITSILIDGRDGKNYFSRFYIKRVLRIFPLYYAVVILFFTIYFLFSNKVVLNEILPYLFYYQNISVSSNGWPVNYLLPLNHFWSLGVEEQFYFLFPMIIYFVRPKKLWFWFVILITLSICLRLYFHYILRNNTGAYVFTLCRFDSLLIGGLTCLYARSRKILNIWIVIPLLLIFLIASFLTPDANSSYFCTIGYTLNALLFGSLLLFSLSKKRLASILFKGSLFMHFGKIAYGLYVFHHIYFIYFDYYLSKHYPGIPYLIVAFLVFGFSYATALFSYKYFEKPILGLKARYVGRIDE